MLIGEDAAVEAADVPGRDEAVIGDIRHDQADLVDVGIEEDVRRIRRLAAEAADDIALLDAGIGAVVAQARAGGLGGSGLVTGDALRRAERGEERFESGTCHTSSLTRRLKCWPRTSKFGYQSKDAHAGESVTMSPALASRWAISTASSMEEACRMRILAGS